MSKDKTKEFTNFIKQDFDIVKDYKNASKELTPLEALYELVDYADDRRRTDLEWTFISEKKQTIKQALTELEKRDTPMKATYGWKDGRMVNIDCPNCNQSINATPFCPHCGKTLDWEKE